MVETFVKTFKRVHIILGIIEIKQKAKLATDEIIYSQPVGKMKIHNIFALAKS